MFSARALLASTDDPNYTKGVDVLMRNERKLTERRARGLLEETGIDMATLDERIATRKPATDQLLARNAAQAAEIADPDKPSADSRSCAAVISFGWRGCRFS